MFFLNQSINPKIRIIAHCKMWTLFAFPTSRMLAAIIWQGSIGCANWAVGQQAKHNELTGPQQPCPTLSLGHQIQWNSISSRAVSVCFTLLRTLLQYQSSRSFFESFLSLPLFFHPPAFVLFSPPQVLPPLFCSVWDGYFAPLFLVTRAWCSSPVFFKPHHIRVYLELNRNWIDQSQSQIWTDPSFCITEVLQNFRIISHFGGATAIWTYHDR